MKDSYTVNYLAFLEDIEAKVRIFKSKRSIAGDLRKNYPGYLIDVDLPKLIRPEIGTVNFYETMNRETSFHPVLKEPRALMNGREVMNRIKRHLLEHPVKLEQFFEGFDRFNTGYITKGQFVRALDILGVSGLQKLLLMPQEIDEVADLFADPDDSSLVDWISFVDNVRCVYGEKNLHKDPRKVVQVPPEEILNLPKQGAYNWDCVSRYWNEICQDALYKIRATVVKRKLEIDGFFQDFDR